MNSIPEIKVVTIRENIVSEDSAQLLNPQSIREFWKNNVETANYFDSEKEFLVVVALNTKYKVCGWNLVSMGRPLIFMAAYGFVLMHNHPSDNPTPSEADRRLTRRIHEAADLLMIRFVDHVIVGEPNSNALNSGEAAGYYSFKENCMI